MRLSRPLYELLPYAYMLVGIAAIVVSVVRTRRRSPHRRAEAMG